MNHDVDYLKDYLRTYKVNPSTIRLNVLDLLLYKDGHLTADEIYKELKDHIPTLSKTSIYNTLEVFSEHKLIKSIALNEKEHRFDIETKPHGHFKCISCQEVYDFDIDDISYKGLKDFEILEKDIQLYGLCKNCK